MKTFACLCVVLAYVVGCSEAPASSGPVETTTQTLALEGLHCQGCVDGIVEKLKAIDGVVAAEGTFESGKATVTTRAGGPSAQVLIAAVESLGYKAKPASAAEPKPETTAAPAEAPAL